MKDHTQVDWLGWVCVWKRREEKRRRENAWPSATLLNVGLSLCAVMWMWKRANLRPYWCLCDDCQLIYSTVQIKSNKATSLSLFRQFAFLLIAQSPPDSFFHSLRCCFFFLFSTHCSTCLFFSNLFGVFSADATFLQRTKATDISQPQEVTMSIFGHTVHIATFKSISA